MNQSVKSVVVLFSICLIVTVLLSGVNFITGPVIEAHNEQVKFGSLYEVIPDAQGFEDVSDKAVLPATVTGVFQEKSGLGYAVTLSTTSQFSKDNMVFTVAIDAEGKIVAVKLTNYADSKDFGASYPEKYVGTDASSVQGVDLVGGVTYSSTAFKNAVVDAFAALSAVKEAN